MHQGKPDLVCHSSSLALLLKQVCAKFSTQTNAHKDADAHKDESQRTSASLYTVFTIYM